ncbi:MAG: hypothetical protein ACK533_12985, partial [Planctomycetota bacterium]
VPADVANVLRPLQLRLPFVLLDLATLDEAAIDGFRLSVVSSLALRLLQFVRRLDPAAALAQMRRWAPLLKQLLAHPRGKDVVHALLWWYSARVGGSPEGLRIIMTKLQEDDEEFPAYSLLDFLLDEGREQGMKKGIQQGEHLGMRQLLESLLRTRFGVDPAPYADRLAAADLATMQSWGERLLRAPTIEQVFA